MEKSEVKWKGKSDCVNVSPSRVLSVKSKLTREIKSSKFGELGSCKSTYIRNSFPERHRGRVGTLVGRSPLRTMKDGSGTALTLRDRIESWGMKGKRQKKKMEEGVWG